MKNNTTKKSQVEKINWLKLKEKKKQLRETRKAKKLNNAEVYDIVVEAKQINEKLRRSDCTLENRAKLTKMLHEKLKTFYNRIIFTHDISRIIQCMIKYCEADVQQAIFQEIKPFIVEISQSKYSKNCIRAILKYGSQEIKKEVISTFYGNIVKLMSHTVSAPLIELTYSSWCKPLDKIYFKQEFYGNMYKQTKDLNIKTLSDVLKVMEDIKLPILSTVKTNLINIVKKGLVDSTLLHTVLWEFFCVCSAEDKSELIFVLRSFFVTLSKTKMGARVAVQCIWHGNNKDRKVIMKGLKENVKMVCMSEHGYITLLALFDSVDDTIILKKMIVAELQKDLVEIALNEHGRHVILYLVAKRDSHYFPPSIIEYLRQGDNNLISKKPADVREKELLEAIRNPFLKAITTDVATWLSNSNIAMVTLAILKVGSGEELSSTFESIAKFICGNFKIKQNDIEYNVIEHSGLHMMLKKLIQNDKELLKKNESTFGEILISQLTADILSKWIEFNRSCFLLILLMENEAQEIVHTLLCKLKPLIKDLRLKNTSGASILLKKIEQEKNSNMNII